MLMILIKSVIPNRSKVRGRKQAIIQEKYLFILKSYQKIFFKVNPVVKKEVKVVKIPKSKVKTTIPLPRLLLNPMIASEVVSDPVMPKIKKIKNNETKIAIKVAKIITFLRFLRLSTNNSLTSGIKDIPVKEKNIAPYGKKIYLRLKINKFSILITENPL